MGVLVPADICKREIRTMPASVPSSSDHLDSVGFIGAGRSLVRYDGNRVELTRGEERDSRDRRNERQKLIYETRSPTHRNLMACRLAMMTQEHRHLL